MPKLRKVLPKKACTKKSGKKPMRRKLEVELFTGEDGEHSSGTPQGQRYNFNFTHRPATRTRQEAYVNVKPILGYALTQYIHGKGGPRYARDMHPKSGDYNTTTHYIKRAGETRRRVDFKALGDFIKEKSNGKFILVSGKVLVAVKGNKTVKRTSVLTKAEFDEIQAIFRDNFFQKRTSSDKKR